MTADELEALRVAKGWTIGELAEQLRRSRRMTIYYLRGGEAHSPVGGGSSEGD